VIIWLSYSRLKFSSPWLLSHRNNTRYGSARGSPCQNTPDVAIHNAHLFSAAEVLLRHESGKVKLENSAIGQTMQEANNCDKANDQQALSAASFLLPRPSLRPCPSSLLGQCLALCLLAPCSLACLLPSLWVSISSLCLVAPELVCYLPYN